MKSTTSCKSGSGCLVALHRSVHIWGRKAESPENLTKEATKKPGELWKYTPRKTYDQTPGEKDCAANSEMMPFCLTPAGFGKQTVY